MDMATGNKTSGLAGLIYLIFVITGIFSLAYAPSQLTVPGNPQATLANIVGSESLFRWYVAVFLIKEVVFLPLLLVLYRLLRSVDTNAAWLMVALAAVSVPIALVSIVNQLNALSLLTDPYYASTFTAEHLQATAALSLDAYRNGLLVTKMFWGLWLLPFGYLVLRSGFLPKTLGILFRTTRCYRPRSARLAPASGFFSSVPGDPKRVRPDSSRAAATDTPNGLPSPSAIFRFVIRLHR